jgi:hypothetical protein
MPAARIICPGCKIVLSSAQALAAGKLVDCPRCRLLFVTTADDITNPLSRAEEIAAEWAWTEADVPRPYPKRSPYTWQRRFRGLTAAEIGSLFLACGIMLVLGGVVVSTYVHHVSGLNRGPATAPPAAAPPVIAGEPVSPPPADVREVEDDQSLPRNQVPSLDDDPPGKPAPP